MKKLLALSGFILILSSTVFSQSEKQLTYSLGVGFGNENSVSNYGIYLSNDLKIPVAQKISLNPRLSFFQSLGSIEQSSDYGYRSHTGLFIEPGVSYFPFSNGLSINAGPSLQIGNATYLETQYADPFGEGTIDRYKNDYLRRIGFYFDVEFSWVLPSNRISTLGIKSSSFEIFPEFLALTYKIGFVR